jgi:putative endopeptidase
MLRHFLHSVASIAVVTCLAITASAQVAAFETTRMDTSISPCGDFYEYVNGNWLRSTEIPASESRWGTFNILAENNNEILKEVLESAAATVKARRGTDTQLIGDFYATCMDEAAIETAGLTPFAPVFAAINGIRTPADVQRAIAVLHNNGIPAVFGFGVGADLKESNAVIVNAGQGGLSLPNREYYEKTDEKSIETRRKFVEHVANMFTLLGDDEAMAKTNANTVLLMQTQLAKASLTPVELRNPDNRYNMVALADAQKATPDFSWANYMRARGIRPAGKFNLPGVQFFEEANSMLREIPARDWKTYLRWMTINSAAPTLSKAYRDESFEFYGRYLSGQKEQQPRWKTCVQAVNSNLGEALGMEYANRVFKPEAKARMNELIDNLMAAMKDRINNLEWMSAPTKQEAQKKLSTFKRKIGYPDVLRGYKGLTVDRSSYAANVQRANKFQIERNFQDLGKPRDKTRWGFTPPTVNASYSSANNEITFPAGILQPPFFNFDADDAVNYGAIGGVIGHEITHGFDDQGSRFDAEGNLKMWWTAEDRAKFEERAACVVKQWDEYEVQPGLFMQGKLALGENIGDFAGLSVAYDAYMRSLEGKPKPANIDGFTPEQRFFLGWAQVWAGKYTPEAERRQVQTGPHSLPKWRVNGPLSNMPQFRQAFSCKAGDAMVRENACAIW